VVTAVRTPTDGDVGEALVTAATKTTDPTTDLDAERQAAAAPPPPERRHTIVGDLRDVARELYESRELLHQLILRDIRIRYKQATLGFAWALLMPTVIVMAGVAVRAAIAYAAGVHLNEHQIAAMAVKSVPWAFFVGCISLATPSLISNISLVTKIYFPREVLPLGAMLAQSFDSMIGAALVVVVVPFFGVGLSAQLLWVPLLIALLWTLSAAAALFLSCANLFFRDVKYLVQVFLTFGIFVTPVLMDAAMFGPQGSAIVMMNPIAPLLEGLRLAVVEQHNLLEPYVAPGRGFVVWRPWYLAYSAGVALFGLAMSAVVFHRSERRFAEII
jgi:lipopolysaccharide transport system permease protein